MPLLLAALAALLAPAVAAAADPPPAGPAAETDIGVVATAVRVTGARCEHPRRLEADPAATLVDRPAWIITCEDGRFQVIFEGDTGPKVTPLD